MNSVLELARPDILTLQPYSHAAWLPTLERMHANEMPWRANGDESATGLNRYPEPQPPELIARLAELYDVSPQQVLAGRGSDEAIDLLVRAFCRAGQDSVMLCPPTFGMYKVAARIQGAGVVEVPLLKDKGFALDEEGVLAAWKPGTKILFLCSPNNPTGSTIEAATVERLCVALADKALVAVDEAYAEFSESPGVTRLVAKHANLVVFRTLSKAYALAGARCGVLIAHPDIITLLLRIIPPYAMPSLTVEAVMQLTDSASRKASAEHISTLLVEREKMASGLMRSSLIRRVWPSHANFLLVECTNADKVLEAVRSANLIVRDQRSHSMLPETLRISIGTPEQNQRLLAAVIRAGAGQ